MNDLKPINDRLGHDAGDVALQLLARALRNLFRVTDPLFRLGGDEFLVLMPGGTADELVRRMEALDQALLGQRFPKQPTQIDVRIAWGVAAYTDADSLTRALSAADDAMYAQKKERKGGATR
jgi:diguanylate cyclase (GGDEF)-like protein